MAKKCHKGFLHLKKCKKPFLFFILATALLISFFYPLFDKKRPIKGPFLSKKEESDLKLFFHHLFAENELGYTLFGDKPMSICFPATIKPQLSRIDFTFKFLLDGDIPLFSGLKVWNKIKHALDNEKYSLIIHEDWGYPSFIIFVNKKAFNEVVNENLDIFRKVYGNESCAETLLKKN